LTGLHDLRKPLRPPVLADLLAAKLKQDPEFFVRAPRTITVAGERYMPWDHLRFRRPPEGLTHEDWWLATKFSRELMKRPLPLKAADGRPFTYALADEVLRGIEIVDKHLSGRIGVPEPVTHDAPSRARYVVTSLIEEAITSSQLEGASTAHRVAKEMLRTGRAPRTRDERMIINNYNAMQRVSEVRDEDLTPALICDLHRIVTEGKLDDAAGVGRIQLPGESRVLVEDIADGVVLHVPPPSDELPARLQAICDFANSAPSDGAYVPPVIRAIIVHFMLAHDHPFVDGNGRTARVLFYWSMLHEDYWLTEFLPISRLLKQAPAKYARSFLHCEQDDGDLTYFLIYQLGIIQRTLRDLQTYLERKVAESRRIQESLTLLSRHLNYRQVTLLGHAVKNPHARYTVQSHSRSHNVVTQTARTDLQALESQGFLVRESDGRGYAWSPAHDLSELLDPARNSSGRHRRRSTGAAARGSEPPRRP
jgi:Fic family protein